MNETTAPVYDIVVIGSGIACTSTITALVNELRLGGHALTLPVHLAVIEKYPELWKGIPYGNRSSVNALTITTLHDFFTDDAEREKFLSWFIPQKNELLDRYLMHGSHTASAWHTANKQALIDEQWKDIYLPRSIIGKYISESFEALALEAENAGLITFKTITGEAVAIQDKGGEKLVTIETGTLRSQRSTSKLVIAIGSAPAKKLTHAFDDQHKVLYINDLHARDLQVTLKAIKKKLTASSAGKVLIVGSNASAIELLYLLQHTSELAGLAHSITMLSTGGKLPAGITYEQHHHQVTANLDRLSSETNYNLEQLVSAADNDLVDVIHGAVSVPDVDLIMAKTISMLAPLSNESKKLFYAIRGIQLARIFRRSGPEYSSAAAKLINAAKLHLIKGTLINITHSAAGTTVAYKDEDNQKTLDDDFAVVVNCTGANDLDKSSSRLIDNLIVKNGLVINSSKKAFIVGADLQAAPGIYIIGPLAGGNYNSLLYFWHLENASRIIYLSKHLAKQLVK